MQAYYSRKHDKIQLDIIGQRNRKVRVTLLAFACQRKPHGVVGRRRDVLYGVLRTE